MVWVVWKDLDFLGVCGRGVGAVGGVVQTGSVWAWVMLACRCVEGMVGLHVCVCSCVPGVQMFPVPAECYQVQDHG